MSDFAVDIYVAIIVIACCIYVFALFAAIIYTLAIDSIAIKNIELINDVKSLNEQLNNFSLNLAKLQDTMKNKDKIFVCAKASDIKKAAEGPIK